MVFTQGRGFVVGVSFVCHVDHSDVIFGLPPRGHRLFGNVISFW